MAVHPITYGPRQSNWGWRFNVRFLLCVHNFIQAHFSNGLDTGDNWWRLAVRVKNQPSQGPSVIAFYSQFCGWEVQAKTW